MYRLSEQQLRALNNSGYSRNGVSAPDTTASDAPHCEAICWDWALAGESVGIDANTSANSFVCSASALFRLHGRVSQSSAAGQRERPDE